MFKYKVRPASVADFPALRKLKERLYGSPITKSRVEAVYKNTLADAGQAVFVAVHSGNVVGYIHARQVTALFEERYTEIAEIAVYDYYADKNACSELVSAVEKWSAQMLSSSVRINVHDGKQMEMLLNIGFHGSRRGGLEKIIYSERKNCYE
ncbi:MAG: GNAT family N-acetyltransferase [Lachnospiraceae bacterium]|nr:GNAT family N-acetyltransferase [Ruminococcus sp.]MCM1274004.1 GNAT family N-acetyltransferase [Lachnospiraceae bacterium]